MSKQLPAVREEQGPGGDRFLGCVGSVRQDGGCGEVEGLVT
jgi:hypothetical protein